MYWIAKKIKDVDDKVIGYEKPKYKISSPLPPDSDHMAFIDMESVTVPKMESFIADDSSTQWKVVEDTDAKEIVDKAKEVDDYIKFEAAKTFQSTTVEAMLASMGSCLLRLMNPSEYISAGLVVEVETDSFTTLGESLDTAQKIGDYYKELLISLDLKREVKKTEYKDLKKAKGK